MKTKFVPVVLSLVGAAGTVATGVFAAMETPKAMESLKALKEEKGENMTKLDYLKWFGKSYWKTILTGSASVSSTTVGTIISQKNQASLAATAMFVKGGYDKYKYKIKELLGSKVHREVLDSIAKDDSKTLKRPDHDNRDIYWEEHIGYFLSTEKDITYAYADLNQRLHCDEYGRQNNDEATLKDFLDLCHGEVMANSAKEAEAIEKALNNIGFTPDYLFENYEYCWIHMTTESALTGSEEPYTKIFFLEEPIVLPYFGEDDARSEIYYPNESTAAAIMEDLKNDKD